MAYTVALGITVVMEAALFALAIALFVSAQRARRSAAPYYPTPARAIRAALAAADLRPGESFYDLGAGAGKALLIAEKEFGARAKGFEISLLPYWLGKINLFLHGSHAALVPKNFFDAELKSADVIFCFLAIRTMKKMGDKIKTGLKPGARVIVYAFPLPNMTPASTIAIHGKWEMFIYKNIKNKID
jgi:SAM-dependent methyltransferase